MLEQTINKFATRLGENHGMATHEWTITGPDLVSEAHLVFRREVRRKDLKEVEDALNRYLLENKFVKDVLVTRKDEGVPTPHLLLQAKTENGQSFLSVLVGKMRELGYER